MNEGGLRLGGSPPTGGNKRERKRKKIKQAFPARADGGGTDGNAFQKLFQTEAISLTVAVGTVYLQQVQPGGLQAER
jgi:hypothetical protein